MPVRIQQLTKELNRVCWANRNEQAIASAAAKTFNRLLYTRLVVVVVYRFSCPSRRRNGAGFTSETT